MIYGRRGICFVEHGLLCTDDSLAMKEDESTKVSPPKEKTVASLVCQCSGF